MSRVSSLGLHTPAALPYCITESLLPDPPPPNSYTWTTGLPHEELLVTGSAVIWSQGGVVRRVFRYDVEREPVVQALLTWFPSDDPSDTVAPPLGDDDDDSGYVSSGSESNKRKTEWEDEAKSKKRTNTISSKTKSYIAQLGSVPKARGAGGTNSTSGSDSHPSREADDDDGLKAVSRARALVVLLRTQAFVYFLSGTMHVIHLPFEVDHAISAPRGLVLQRKLPTPPPPPADFCTGNSFTARPVINTKDSPRLFTLMDPLYEVGLVMNTSGTATTEELLYISPASELDSSSEQARGRSAPTDRDVIFAVTYNRDREQITAWQVRYVPQDQPIHQPSRRTPSVSGTTSRRRSSMGTGATTPTTGTLSAASAATLRPGRDSLAPGMDSSLVSLGEDFEGGARRSSRRVSSLVARADLSGHHDPGQRFSDVSSSIGASFTAPSAPQNTMVVDEQPVDELLQELNMGALGIGMDDIGAYSGEGLKQEMLMHKLESFPAKLRKGFSVADANSPARVFTLRSPSSVQAAVAAGKEPAGQRIALFFVNREQCTLLQLNFHVQVHTAVPKAYSRRSSARLGAVAMGYTLVLTGTDRRNDVLDAIKVQDYGIERVLILRVDGKFSLYSPWTPSLDVFLPPTLARWNPNAVGEDGSRRGSRKKGFAKSLSTSPEVYEKLNYTEPSGRLTVVDGEGVGHRISIVMVPRDASIRNCLETLRVVFGATASISIGEGFFSVWMAVSKWLMVTADPEASLTKNERTVDPMEEWRSFVVTLFILAAPLLPEQKPPARRRSGFVRSTSVALQKEWEDLVSHEGEWGSAPEYSRGVSWTWMMEENEVRAAQPPSPQSRTKGPLGGGANEGRLTNKFIIDCVMHARQFLKSPSADRVQDEYLSSGADKKEVRRTSLAVALAALHLLREEWKLDIAMDAQTRRMCPVLRQMATWLGWHRWAESYMLEDVEMVGWEYDISQITSVNVPEDPFPPPDIHEWMTGCLKGAVPQSFMVLQDIISPPTSHKSRSTRPRNPFSPPPLPPAIPEQRKVFQRLTPRTKIITALYTTLATPGSTDVDVVEKMVELNVTTASLLRLPEGASAPLREAIARCQEQPPTTWGVRPLELVGRKDLKMLVDMNKSRSEKSAKWQSTPTHEAARDVHVICNSTFDNEAISTFDSMAEHDRLLVSRLLFKDDRRLHEAQKLLQSNKPSLAKCVPEPQWNEQDMLDAYKDIASYAALRTLAVPPGRGLLTFSARIPLLTEKFPITGFNLNCIVKPSNTTVSAEKSSFIEEKVCWSFFHAGVAAGVSISREAKEIDTSWIVFNKPQDLTNRHAGFLFGLGLNGHLKNIAKWHAFNYLTPKHPMVSIGLLLGLAVSYLGTMDTTITKLLSVHVTRLLPPGSAELNLSPLTQTAGIFGIGLLYAQSQHRRMSEVMLSEIEYVEVQDSCVPSDSLRDEGYRLAAGFGLGFINLGSGKDLRGMHDMHLVERLLALAVGSKKVSIIHILDKATAGATIALGLIYLKTNDKGLAKKIDIPDTVHLLDYVRPDIFLLRTVAKNLILWDEIHGSFRWLREQLKPFHRPKARMTDIMHLDSEDLPFYNIITGLCFSIGLRYAGSGDEAVRDVLIHYLDQFIRLCSLPAVNHDQKLTRTSVRNCQDLLSLSAATVMAGTGDIPVFRRLRKLHARLDADITYGSHLATHLSIGVLFLGNGSFTFGTENVAIASLLCAFYPLFPTGPLDNQSHLQAFRHLWTLAVESRCVIPRDVESLRPTQIPITITLRSGQELTRTAPCLLPDLKTVASVTTTSPAYWTVVLDLDSPIHRQAFERSQSIFIHRRSAHASQSTVFQATLQALDEVENLKAPMEWIGDLGAFAGLDKAEKALVIREGELGGGECVDERLELEKGLRDGKNKSRLKGVKMACLREGGLWVAEEVVEGLRAGVWVRGG